MASRGNGNGATERLRIQEKALSNLADTLRRNELEASEEISDLRAEIKALKLFLARALPDFKKQFPEIRRKLK